jgi:pilus assembly protein CpaC
MVLRLAKPRMALLAGLVVTVGACTASHPPKVAKESADAAARAKAKRAVEESVNKEKAVGAVPKKHVDAKMLRAGEAIWLQSGKSRVVELPYNVTRVSIGNPDLAGVVVLGPRSILINAKEMPRDQDQQQQMQMMMGQRGRGNRAGVLSPFPLTQPPVMAETTVILWDSANKTDSHTVFVAEFIAEQVLLEVTVAELNRTEMEERGIDFQSLGSDFRSGYWMGGGEFATPVPTTFLPGLTTNLSPVPLPLTVSSEQPTFAFQVPGSDITAFITALQTEGLAKLLAQPKILALSGQNAVFQVGGEIPIRIVTAFTSEIEFKPFGTLVNFQPRVTEEGDIYLTVTPEVSAPDFNSLVEGVPTFRTRRASTTARLREGETLVLGGLVQQARIESERGVPYLKDLPYVGNVFRTTSYVEETNELMVIVTPHLVQNLPPGAELELPSERPPLTRGEARTQPENAPVSRPRIPTPGDGRSNRPPQ